MHAVLRGEWKCSHLAGEWAVLSKCNVAPQSQHREKKLAGRHGAAWFGAALLGGEVISLKTSGKNWWCLFSQIVA